MPAFMRNPAPLVEGDRRDRARHRTARRAPVGAALGRGDAALRGVVQPLTERSMLRDLERLSEGLRLADHPGESEAEDPLLGVSAARFEQRRRRPESRSLRAAELRRSRSTSIASPSTGDDGGLEQRGHVPAEPRHAGVEGVAGGCA